MLRADPRVRCRAGELVVDMFNGRMFAFKGTNSIGHAKVILKVCEDVSSGAIGLQDVRRDGQSAFITAAGYAVFSSGADGGKQEKKGNHA